MLIRSLVNSLLIFADVVFSWFIWHSTLTKVAKTNQVCCSSVGCNSIVCSYSCVLLCFQGHLLCRLFQLKGETEPCVEPDTTQVHMTSAGIAGNFLNI